MPDMSQVLKEAFPVGGAGPTVRRWWPLAHTAVVTACMAWATPASWFGLVDARIPMEFTGGGDVVMTSGDNAASAHYTEMLDGSVLPWGYGTAALAVIALLLVAASSFRSGLEVARDVASGLLALATLIGLAVWIAPDLMVGGVLDAIGAFGAAGGGSEAFIPKSGLVVTIVAAATGATALFVQRRVRPRAVPRSTAR